MVVLALSAEAVAQPAAPRGELAKEFQAGVDAFRLGKLALARTHLERARALDPKLPGPNRFLAAVAKADGRWQDCIDAARKAIQLNPRSAELADTRKVHDECRVSAGRAPYRDELGDSAAIAVTTNVPGATVKVGGLTYGGTPLAPRPITAGTLEVELDKAGWKPAHVAVEALAGIVTDVSVELEPDPSSAGTGTTLGSDVQAAQPTSRTTGYLAVRGGGGPGDLAIDGDRVTLTNDKLVVAPGTHVLELRVPAHDPWRRRVRISAGQTTVVAPAPVATARREHTERIGIAVVGGSAAIAAFGFYAALRSGSASAHAREIDRLETARPPAGMYTRAEFEDARASAHRWSRISTAALGTGVITLGIGAALMYFGGREPADGLPPFAVTPPATGAGAVVTREVAW